MHRLLVLLLPLAALAQAQKPDPKNQPRVIVVAPLGMAPGSTSKLTIRGLKLDSATEVRLSGSKGAVKILSKGKVAVPNTQKPEKVGDSEVQVEITLPADVAEGTIPLVVVTPGGTTEAHKVLITRGVIAEKEPNNGYRQAQPLTLPAVVDGAIGTPQDVDVFRFEGKTGQKIVAEVFAERHGSPLDGVLTLIDERGAILASNDDAEGADPMLAFTLPRDGTYYLSLIDAHDQGGPTHVYRLKVK